MERALKGDLFELSDKESFINNKTIYLYRVIDFENKLKMKVTPQLEKEYCCFYHFLIGKRRIMEKSNKINVR